MTTLTETRPTVKPRKPRTLKPVTVVLDGLAYDPESGTGSVVLNGHFYALTAVRCGGRTVGLSFGKLDGTARRHDVDFTVSPWSCDCEDAIFNNSRPGGCKHAAACRQMARQLRG